MRRAALYARVSTKAQKDEGTSLHSQLEAMRAWAEEKGYGVAHEFSEPWTGTQVDRPKLDEIKHLAQTRQIDALIVYSWDRLARDMRHQHVLRYLFEEKWATEIVCITEPEMDEMASKVYQSTIAIAAEIENDLRRERTMRGVRQAALEKGQLPSGGQGLYGYDYSAKSRGGNGKRTINEEEARVVDLIFRSFVEEKLTIYRIAKRLEEMGILTKKGKEKWCYSVLDRLLRNPAYCGKTYAYRWETVEPKNPLKASRRSKKSSTRLRPQEEWIELNEGCTPPIVSEELWKAAQKRLKESFKMRREPKYPYLLRGMVRCYCGKRMAACSISEERRYYRCSAKSGVDPSHHFLVPAQILEDEVWDQVKGVLTGPPDHLFRFLEKDTEDKNGVLRERIAEVEKVIADLDEAESRAISLYSSGKIDRRKIDKRVDRIVAEREARVEDLADWEKRLQTKLQLQASKERILEWVEVTGGGRDEVSLRIGERVDELLEATLEERSFMPKHELLRTLDLRVYMKERDVERVEWKDRELTLHRLEIPEDSSITREVAGEARVIETGEVAIACRTVRREHPKELCFVALLDLASICTIFPTPSPWGSQNPHPPPSPTGIL